MPPALVPGKGGQGVSLFLQRVAQVFQRWSHQHSLSHLIPLF